MTDEIYKLLIVCSQDKTSMTASHAITSPVIFAVADKIDC